MEMVFTMDACCWIVGYVSSRKSFPDRVDPELADPRYVDERRLAERDARCVLYKSVKAVLTATFVHIVRDL